MNSRGKSKNQPVTNFAEPLIDKNGFSYAPLRMQLYVTLKSDDDQQTFVPLPSDLYQKLENSGHASFVKITHIYVKLNYDVKISHDERRMLNRDSQIQDKIEEESSGTTHEQRRRLELPTVENLEDIIMLGCGKLESGIKDVCSESDVSVCSNSEGHTTIYNDEVYAAESTTDDIIKPNIQASRMIITSSGTNTHRVPSLQQSMRKNRSGRKSKESAKRKCYETRAHSDLPPTHHCLKDVEFSLSAPGYSVSSQTVSSKRDTSKNFVKSTSSFRATRSQVGGLYEPKPYECETCGKSFSKCGSLSAHQRIHSGERPYKCELCYKSFAQRGVLQSHTKSVHTNDKPYVCDVCGQSFIWMNKLQVHNRKHTGEKPYQCNQCLKMFSRPAGLRIHKRIHTGERPFLCKTCNKTFVQLSALLVHKRTHTGERPYSCQLCTKTFTSMSGLQSHIRSQHTGERPFKCQLCPKSFVDRCGLRTHASIHAGSKSFVCEECGKAFHDLCHLRSHKKCHSDLRPHACQTCASAFKDRQTLRKHVLRAHSSVKAHACDVCARRFADTSSLAQHRRRNHGSDRAGSEQSGYHIPTLPRSDEHSSSMIPSNISLPPYHELQPSLAVPWQVPHAMRNQQMPSTLDSTNLQQPSSILNIFGDLL